MRRETAWRYARPANHHVTCAQATFRHLDGRAAEIAADAVVLWWDRPIFPIWLSGSVRRSWNIRPLGGAIQGRAALDATLFSHLD